MTQQKGTMQRQSNLFAASLMGGIMGSAVTAAYMLLNDADNRRKLFDTLDTLLESTGLDEAMEQGRDRLSDTARDAKDTVRDAKDGFGNRVERMRNEVSEKAGQARDVVEGKVDNAKDTAKDVAKETKKGAQNG